MKLKKIAALLAVAGISSTAFATNGDNLIGLGAMSRALGGTGTAAFFGAENALSNPALLGKMKGTEFSIAGTAFMPDVTATTNVSGALASKNSDADFFAIPEVSLANRLNDNWTFGLGMYGTSGMGVDYRGNNGLFHAYSNLQMMKFVPSVAYNGKNFGLGFALAVQYGALDLNYIAPPPVGNVGNGTSSDFGAGVNLGAYYDVTKDLTVGVSYQSEIAMKYKDQLTRAADGFGIGPNGMRTITSDKLSQPAEFKLGVAYTTGPWLLTADYKRIYWGSADGYKSFNWEDQDVFGLGVKYSGNGWWIGVGYNYGKDPIKVLPSQQSMTGYSNQAVNMFNNLFFPAIVENHFTFGGGVAIGKNSSLDVAVVYADKISKTIDTGTISGVMGGFGPGVPVNLTTQKSDHSQTAVTVSVRMNF
jgi:long-chain fatty acid transport protein